MKELLNRIVQYAGTLHVDGLERPFLLKGRQAAFAIRSVEHIQTLSDVAFGVFSQFDEDGILEWLVSRLPGIPAAFLEFGVEDYREANTYFLLRNCNWGGLVMDGSPENIKKAYVRFW